MTLLFVAITEINILVTLNLPVGWRGGLRHRFQCGRFWCRFPGQSNQTQGGQRLVIGALLSMVPSCGDRPAICNLLRCIARV